MLDMNSLYIYSFHFVKIELSFGLVMPPFPLVNSVWIYSPVYISLIILMGFGGEEEGNVYSLLVILH